MNDGRSGKKPGNDQQANHGRLMGIRSELDDLDDKLLVLLNRRAALCREVGRIKSESKDSVFKPFREKEVMRRLINNSAGDIPDDHLRAVYREILSSSRRLQQPQTIVYLGPEGTFSYFAGIEYLGRSAEFLPCRHVKEVFRAVAENEAQLGIVPLENSLQGSVGQCLDMFLDYDVYIQAEVFCKISHALLSTEASLADISTVYSHPQALEQCSEWLRIHLPEAQVVPVESTAAAGKRVLNASGCGAIGHEKLAEMMGLSLLSKPIEDLPDNWTRFIIIGAAPPGGGSQDKTSVLFTLPDKSGALVGVLTILARQGINMKKLESRPLRSERWQYVFFADLECDLSSREYDTLTRELEECCQSLRILGSYPAGPYLQKV